MRIYRLSIERAPFKSLWTKQRNMLLSIFSSIRVNFLPLVASERAFVSGVESYPCLFVVHIASAITAIHVSPDTARTAVAEPPGRGI
jgi:hypothetical protein